MHAHPLNRTIVAYDSATLSTLKPYGRSPSVYLALLARILPSEFPSVGAGRLMTYRMLGRAGNGSCDD